MAPTTRYDELASLIDKDFERSQTFTAAALQAGERDVIVSALQEDWLKDNQAFGNFSPYNSVSVDNQSSTAVRVHLAQNRDWYFDVQAGSSRRLVDPVYFNYVEVEEVGGSAVSADEVHVTVAKYVDSRELDLLKMSGLLNI